MDEKLLSRIVVDPDVMVGKPVIKGTRIPVDTIMRLLAQGMTMDDILDDYPHLSREDVKAALLYGAATISGEDIFPLMKNSKKNAKFPC